MGRKVCVNIITKNAVMRFTYRFSALFFEACTTHHTLLTIILCMYSICSILAKNILYQLILKDIKQCKKQLLCRLLLLFIVEVCSKLPLRNESRRHFQIIFFAQFFAIQMLQVICLIQIKIFLAGLSHRNDSHQCPILTADCYSLLLDRKWTSHPGRSGK